MFKGLKVLLTCLIGFYALSISAFVEKERKIQKSMAPFEIKQRTIHTESKEVKSQDKSLMLGGLKTKSDKLSGSIRLLSGQFNLPSLKQGSAKSEYINLALKFVADHPRVFGISPKDLKVANSAVYIGKDEQFVKFKVYRNQLLVSDASIDFRFKRGKLLQVSNQSFAEAKIKNKVVQKDLKDTVARLTGGEVSSQGKLMYRVKVNEKNQSYDLIKVMSFQVESEDGSLTTQINSETRELFEVKDNHYHSGLHVHGELHKRWYDDPIVPHQLGGIKVNTEQGTMYTDSEGQIDTTAEFNNPPTLEGLNGRFVKVVPKTGTAVFATASLEEELWSITVKKSYERDNWLDKDTAQLMVYYHVNKINELAKRYIENPWLDAPLTANTNLSRTCNAHWDGRTINLYSGDNRCGNTGLIADVIYHEWGHGLDAKTGGIDDGAFSEGFGDIMSLIITRSNLLGIGFRLPDKTPVRDLAPKRVYPKDRGEVHKEGLIIGSTFWDLFKAFSARYDEDTAADILANYAFKMILTARTYLDVYDALLVIDDDDQNLDNGTPNLCLLNQVFADHGLTEVNLDCQLASVDAYQVEDEAGDQDGVIEPGETISLNVLAKNPTSNEIVGLTGTLSLTEGEGVTILKDTILWDPIASNTTALSTQPAKIEISEDAVCGSSFSTKLLIKADSREAVATKTFVIGRNIGVEELFTASDLPLDILDLSTTTSEVSIEGEQWTETSTIAKAQLSFDIRHTYVGDLTIHLEDPAGVKTLVYRGKGSSDDVQFDEDISELLAGKPGMGTWKLHVNDRSRRDEGQLLNFALKLTPNSFVCN